MDVNQIISGAIVAGLALAFTGCAATASGEGESNIMQTIPLETVQGRTFIDASFDGTAPERFLLDTGGSNGVFLRSYVDRAGLSLGEPRELSSPLGDNVQMVDTARYDRLTIGELDLPGGSSLIMEDEQFPLPGVNGVVGLAPLNAYMVELDLGASELRVVDAPSRTVAAWQPHPAGEPFYALDIYVGDVAIPAHLDSGNPGAVMLPLAFAEQLPLSTELQEVGRFRTVDAERVIYRAHLDAPMNIGGLIVPAGDVQFADIPFANVGSPTLANWVLVIDAPNERFGLYDPN